ncbi:MAG: hypothetical protein GF416_00385 [Candidatus Altiarchaeales archaeon]|nr:hypothetical protein [Candidatus Altiarchaeales archaeon]MBD3415577.1 hypothetical protein [Candidatus Altiarchaeales archaeon]
MERVDILVLAFVLSLFAFLVATLTPGIWVTDEATYLLMVASFADRGELHVWNGFDEVQTPELLLPGMQLVSNGVEIRMYGIPAPFYTFMAAPFYLLLGVYGLNLMNVIAYCCSVYLLYRMGCLLFSRELAALSSLLYAFTFTLAYSQMLWPHMLSVLFVLSSAYLLLREHCMGSTSASLVFLAGFLSFMSVGVRYTNGVFLMAEMFFVWFAMPRSFKPFIAGMILPAIFLGYLNQKMFGSFLETSYPSEKANFYLTAGVLASALCFAAVELLRRRDFRVEDVDFRLLMIVSALAILAISSFSPGRLALTRAYGMLFDMKHVPDYTGDFKKALLQSTPFITVAALAPYLMVKRRFPVAPMLFITALSLAQILLSLRISGGGADETYSLRYFIDCLPFIALLSAYSISVLAGYLSRRELAYHAFLFLAFTGYLLASGDRLYSVGPSRLIPTALSVGLIASSAALLNLPRMRQLTVILLVLSVSYSASVAYADLRVLRLYKDLVWQTSLELDEHIIDDSVIVYSLTREYPYFAYPKLHKRVRLVAAYMDAGLTLPEVLEYYHKRGSHIYVSGRGGEAWREKTTEYLLENNITGVQYLTYMSHTSDAEQIRK